MAGNGQYNPVSSSVLNVTFVPGPVSASTSSVVVTNPNQPANGTSYATVTVTLEDQYGNVIPSTSVSLTNLGASSVYTATGPLSGTNSTTTNSSGVATFYVADSTAQNVTYGATAQSTSIPGSSSSEASFGFLAQSPLNEGATPSSQTAGQSVQMSASGGSDGGAITYQLASGAPSSCSVNSTTGVLTSNDMAVTCPVIATMAGNGTYAPVNSSVVNVTFNPGPVDASTSSIVVTDGTEPADGASFAIVTVTLEDQYGNVIPSQTVVLTNIGSSSVHTGTAPLSGGNSLSSDSNGTATFYVTDATVENVTYSATAESVTISGSTGTTTADFTVLPQAPLVLSLSPPITSTSPVAGSSPQVQVTGGSGTGALVYQLGPGAPASCAVSSSGVVTSQLAVTCPVLVTKDASGSYGPTSTTINVPFVAGPVSSTTSTVVADPTSVTNPGTTTVTVTLEDQYGNPVDDQTVSLTGTGSASIGASPVSTGGTNIAQFTVSDSAAEITTLSATDTLQSNYAIGSTQVTFTAASSGGGGGGGSSALLVVNTSLPDGSVGQPYTATLSATGATGPTTWTCSGLPPNLTCSSAGAISGTPSVSGTFPVSVTVTSNGQTDTVTIPLTVTSSASTSGDAPTDVVAVAGDSDALVTFVAPSDASQLTGVKYTITAGPGGASCVTTGTSCLITGLTNGTTYTFSVVATSSSPTATSPAGISNPATPTAAPILDGANGVGTTTLSAPTKPLSPGSVSGTVLGGTTTAGSLGVSNSSVTARGDGVTMTITTSSTISTTTGFTVVLVKGGVAKVTGTGFYPGSVVDLYIFSPQIYLASVVVNANGTYSATVRIPSNVPVGNDIVLSQGFVKSGVRASVSAGIVVDASNAALLTLFPFGTGLSTLTPTMDRQLQGFALEVKKFGTRLIVLTGYTDTVGGSAYNDALGSRRAQSAATYLRQALLLDGFTAHIRFVTVSKGSTAPSASNLTAAGRARNRNVTVFAILY